MKDPVSFPIPQYARDVVAMADFLKLDKFTYVGHSMGGGIGYELGVEHGDRLNKLVLVAPIPKVKVHVFFWIVCSERRSRKEVRRQ